MTQGADDSRGQNPETSALSAWHLIENLFSTTDRKPSAPLLAGAFPFERQILGNEIARIQDAAHLRADVAKRQFRRERLHWKSYVRDTLPNY